MNLYRINLILSLSIIIYLCFIFLNYNKNSGQYHLDIDIFSLHIRAKFDKYNILFIFLTNLNNVLCLCYVKKNSKFSLQVSFFFLFCITIFLLCCFCTCNIMIFLFFFEALLIPLIFFIGILGSRSRKISAIYFLIFFTIISSIFLIIGCFLIYSKSNNLYFLSIGYNLFDEIDRQIILYMFFLGFISKVPMMPLHIWLPEVHVEASTVGSVILAAIILKIGFYGLIRVFEIINFFEFTFLFYQIFAVLCLCSLFYGGFVAIRQVDLKKIVAYSSIVHMNIGVLAICNISEHSHLGSLYIMFSHGLISAGMFFCVGFLYERYHTRNIMYFGGLIQYMPIFGLMFILILLSNMSLPGTCNFIGEFIVFFSILKEYGLLVCLCCLSSTFFTSIFCILIFGKVLFYKITGFLVSNLKDLDIEEFGILLNLLYFIFIFGLSPNLVIELL